MDIQDSHHSFTLTYRQVLSQQKGVGWRRESAAGFFIYINGK